MKKIIVPIVALLVIAVIVKSSPAQLNWLGGWGGYNATTTSTPSPGPTIAFVGPAPLPSVSPVGNQVYGSLLTGQGVSKITSTGHTVGWLTWDPTGVAIVYNQQFNGNGVWWCQFNNCTATSVKLSPDSSPSNLSDLFGAIDPDNTTVYASEVMSNTVNPPPTQIVSFPIAGCSPPNSPTSPSCVRTAVVNPSDITHLYLEPHVVKSGGQYYLYWAGTTVAQPHTEIYQCLLSGSGPGVTCAGPPVALTNGACNHGDPGVDPTGTLIAFAADCNSSSHTPNIFYDTFPSSTLNPTQLTFYTPPWSAGDTGFDPTGTGNITYELAYGSLDQNDPYAPASIYSVNYLTKAITASGIPCAGIGCSSRIRPATATPTATATLTPTLTSTASGTPTLTGTPTVTPTPAASVTSSPAMTNTKPIGVNMTFQGAYESMNYMSNMLDNPGFEPAFQADVFVVSTTHTSSTFTARQRFGAGDPNHSGVWNGSSGSVRFSKDTPSTAGATFTIATSTNSGGIWTFTCSGACPTMTATDVVELQIQGTQLASNTLSLGAGWGQGILGNGDPAVTLTTSQHVDGIGSLQFDVSNGAAHQVQYGWDSGGGTFGGVCSDHNTPCQCAAQGQKTCADSVNCGSPLNGTCSTQPVFGPWHPLVSNRGYVCSIYFLALNTTAPTASLSLIRTSGTNTSHTWTLLNDGLWHQYTYNCIGGDTAASRDSILFLTISASNGSAAPNAKIYADDPYVGLGGTSPAGFRQEVTDSLRVTNPGFLRYSIPFTLNTSFKSFTGGTGCTPGANTIGGCDYNKGVSTTLTGTNQYGSWNWYYSPEDVYAEAGQVHAIPWISFPNTFSDSDLVSYADSICHAISTYSLAGYWAEESNEDWNGAINGATLQNQVYDSTSDSLYGAVTGRNLGIIQNEIHAVCPASESLVHYQIGNQLCNSGVIVAAKAGAALVGFPLTNVNDASNDATYVSGQASSPGNLPDYTGTLTSQAAQYASLFFQYPGIANYGSGCVPTDITSSPNNTLAAYEGGVGALVGIGTTAQSYLAQAGFPSAGWLGENWIMGIQHLMPVQLLFALGQTETGNTTQAGPLWGGNVDFDSDFGPAYPHQRPSIQAIALMNRAIAPNYFPVSITTNPTCSANTGPTYPCLQAVAFEDAANDWSFIASNASLNSVVLPITFPAGGTLPIACKTLNYTNDITDTNEAADNVTQGNCAVGLSTVGRVVTATLPPLSLTVLDPADVPTPTPSATPTVSPTPTVTTTSTPSPAPSTRVYMLSGPSPSAVPTPRGGLSGQYYSIVSRNWWDNLEPSDGVFSWNYAPNAPDNVQTLAESHNCSDGNPCHWILTVGAGAVGTANHVQGWLAAAGGQIVGPPTYPLSFGAIPAPTDPVFITKFVGLLTAIYNRYHTDPWFDGVKLNIPAYKTDETDSQWSNADSTILKNFYTNVLGTTYTTALLQAAFDTIMNDYDLTGLFYIGMYQPDPSGIPLAQTGVANPLPQQQIDKEGPTTVVEWNGVNIDYRTQNGIGNTGDMCKDGFDLKYFINLYYGHSRLWLQEGTKASSSPLPGPPAVSQWVTCANRYGAMALEVYQPDMSGL